MMPAGAIRVRSVAGAKWIVPGDITSSMRKLPRPSRDELQVTEVRDGEEEQRAGRSTQPKTPPKQPKASAARSAPKVAEKAPQKPPKEASGWDSEDEEDAGAPLQESGWDSDGQESRREPAADICGAPMLGGGFVAAAPASPTKQGAGNELDDLLGDIFGADDAPTDGIVEDFQCTQCDHPILRICNAIWNEDAVDYMFCRNYYPDVIRLRRSLLTRKGCAAFCCQCSWKSADQRTALRDVATGLRWILTTA